MSVLSACISIHYMHTWCLRRPEEGVRCPVIRITEVVVHRVSASNQTQVTVDSTAELPPHLFLLDVCIYVYICLCMCHGEQRTAWVLAFYHMGPGD